MQFFRAHWFDVGLVLAGGIGVYLLAIGAHGIQLLLWLDLIFLCLHQFEEYRYPGYFPGMMNTVMFASKHPDRYPLNANAAFVINVGIGWGFYFLAALVGERGIWLGIATMLVSVGNIIAHTILFNVKGKTIYNPGMLTALFLFLPLTVYFFYALTTNGFAAPFDWVVGVFLGIVLNYVGILKMIDWLKDEQTPYVFPKRFLIPGADKAPPRINSGA